VEAKGEEIKLTDAKAWEVVSERPDVAKASYDSQPNEVAESFIAVLSKMGIIVDTYYNDDMPELLYCIHPPSKE
jgi:hypothetical protein